MSGRERRCRRKLGRIVVDPATNHVFVTGAASDSAIVVRNEDGSAVKSITESPAPAGWWSTGARSTSPGAGGA